jgi:hypothetical protein
VTDSTAQDVNALVAEAREWFAELMRQAADDEELVNRGRAPSLTGEALVYERAKWAGRIDRLATALTSSQEREKAAYARGVNDGLMSTRTSGPLTHIIATPMTPEQVARAKSEADTHALIDAKEQP